MAKASSVAVQYGKVNEAVLVLEFRLFDDLMKKFGDVCRRIGKCTAAKGGQDQGVVTMVEADAEDRAHLVKGDFCLFGEHHAVNSNAGPAFYKVSTPWMGGRSGHGGQWWTIVAICVMVLLTSYLHECRVKCFS